MELSDAERMLAEMMQNEDARLQDASRQNWARFSRLVSERVGIPIARLRIDLATGGLTDRGDDEQAAAAGTSDDARVQQAPTLLPRERSP